MSQRRKVKVDQERLAAIVGDGLVARNDVYGGVGVPVIVLDSRQLPELAEAVRAAAIEPDGDARSYWGVSGKIVVLRVELLRPVPTDFSVVFDLRTHGIVVESAITARVVQLKCGSPESTFKSTFDDDGLMVEVPGLDEFPPWPAIFIKTLIDQFRRHGLRLSAARQAAEEAYESMSALARLRVAPQTGPSEAPPQEED